MYFGDEMGLDEVTGKTVIQCHYHFPQYPQSSQSSQ